MVRQPQHRTVPSWLARHVLLWALLLSLLLHGWMLEDFSFSVPTLHVDQPEVIQAKLVPMPVPVPVLPAKPPARHIRRVHMATPVKLPPEPAAPVPMPNAVPAESAPNGTAVAKPVLASTPEVADAAKPAAAPAPSPPGSPVKLLSGHFEIQYDLLLGENGPKLGRASYVWQTDANRYTLVSITEARGLLALFQPGRLEQISTGHIDAQGLVPDDFEIQRGGTNPDQITHVHIEADRHTATVTRKGRQYSEPVPEHAQDILSVIFQLALLAPGDKTASFNVSSGKAFKPYHAQVVGEEIVHTALGDLRTLHVSRPPEQNEDGMDIWYAEDLHNAPVKVRVLHSQYGVLEQVVSGMQ